MEVKANMVHVELPLVVLEMALTGGTTAWCYKEWLWDSMLLHNMWLLDKQTHIHLRDRQLIQATTQGDLHSWINVNNSEIDLYFPDVLHVPKLSQNLLSSNWLWD